MADAGMGVPVILKDPVSERETVRGVIDTGNDGPRFLGSALDQGT